MTPIEDPITLYGIIGILAGAVIYLFKDGRNKDKMILEAKDKYADKILQLTAEFQKQQQYWFDKLEIARKK